MSETDAQFVERVMTRWIELIDARDDAGLEGYVEEFYAPDAYIDFGTRTPDALPGQGVEVIVQWARDAFHDWLREGAEFRFEFDQVVDSGNGIVVPARSVGRLQGFELETRFTYLFRVRDGRVQAMVLYATPEEALAAASR